MKGGTMISERTASQHIDSPPCHTALGEERGARRPVSAIAKWLPEG